MVVPKWVVPVGLVVVMLCSGACLTLNQKLQYNTLAVGIYPEMGAHAFRKPWFCTSCMFMGEALALLVFAVSRLRTQETAEQRCELSWFGVLWRSVLPAMLDLSASGFGSVGLLYITASAFQMLRGWAILFTALLSSFWLKTVFETRQILGLGLVLVAMGLVGYTGALTGDKSGEVKSAVDSGLWGVLLVGFAQLFQASQFVWEEKVMKHVFIPPLLLLGIEGVIGVAVMFAGVFPLLMWLPGDDVDGSQEHILDTLAMLQNSSSLRTLFLVYVVCVCALNACAVYVTKILSGVHRTLIQTGLRTMVIWAVGIVLFDSTDGTYGEQWAGFVSYLQLVGFVAFLLGSMLYSKMIDLPCSCERRNSDYKQLPAGP